MPKPNTPAYVYIYRDEAGRCRYIGKGTSADRPMAHSGRTDSFGQWLKTGKFEIEIAGPYRDQQEALEVESALISALRPTSPLFNAPTAPGSGQQFHPLGVPAQEAARLLEPPVSMEETGRATGGALIVYIRSLDLTKPVTEAVATAASGTWQLESRIHGWRANPETGPKVLVGVAGPLRHRFIAGAFDIATDRWAEPAHRTATGRLWWIPLVDRSRADACGLRGRRLTEIAFGRSKSQHFRIVDGDGVIVHPRPALGG